MAPFAFFLLLLGLQDYMLFLGPWQAPLRFAILGAFLLLVARRVVDLRMAAPWTTTLLGLAVCALWIAPDLLWPGYRQHWLFENRLLGSASNPQNAILSQSMVFVVFRILRAVVIVPVVEELFWRGWLMRWLINPDFRSVPMGTYSPRAFWWTAALFALEHGSYWEVGLLAGVAYNWWIVRTKRLGDCIVAHAITNAALSAFVVLSGRWQYWP